MRNLSVLAALLAAVLLPVGSGAQMMSGSGGSHAFDWMLGNWSCKNTFPSALAGPAVQMLTATRSATTGSIIWRYTGKDYDQYGFLSHDSKSGTWWFSWAYPGGAVGNESSKESGKITHWTGMIYDPATGKHLHLRDTYTLYSPSKFNDTGWDDSSGSMKIGYNGTCTRD